jgi:hypothetical protein
LRVKTTVKAGALQPNHNEALVRAGGLKVHTSIKAGEWPPTSNHNEAQVRAGVRQLKPRAKARPKARTRLKVGTAIKAGAWWKSFVMDG